MRQELSECVRERKIALYKIKAINNNLLFKSSRILNSLCVLCFFTLGPYWKSIEYFNSHTPARFFQLVSVFCPPTRAILLSKRCTSHRAVCALKVAAPAGVLLADKDTPTSLTLCLLRLNPREIWRLHCGYSTLRQLWGWYQVIGSPRDMRTTF